MRNTQHLDGIHQIFHGGDVVKQHHCAANLNYQQSKPQAVLHALYGPVHNPPLKQQRGAGPEGRANHENKEEQKRAHFPKQAPKLFQAPGRGRDGDVKQNGNHRGSYPTDNPCKGGNQRAQVQLGKGVQVHNKIAVQFGPAKGIDKFSIHSSHPVAARWGRPAEESAGPAP